MHFRSLSFVLVGVVGACSSAGVEPAAKPSTSTRVRWGDERRIALSGAPTRFDYQAFDAASRTLWIAHLGDDTVERFDVTSETVAATIADVASPHGVAIGPGGLVYVTATGTDEVVAIDTATNVIVARAATGNFPDGVAYDATHNLVLVTNKSDGAITVHDPRTLELTRTIKLGSETGNVVSDPISGHAFAAVRAPNALMEFDPTTGATIRTIALDGCSGAHGVQLASQRAYVACEGNARLIAVDTTSGTVLANDELADGPDVLAYDDGRKLLFIAAESSAVDVFDISGSTPQHLARRTFIGGAHTIALDPSTNRMYLPLAQGTSGPELLVIEIQV